jgi:hypothetical protein
LTVSLVDKLVDEQPTIKAKKNITVTRINIITPIKLGIDQDLQ